MSHQVISIDQWPLFDLRITRFGDNKYRLHFSMDALLADAQSIDIINDELNILYAEPTHSFEPLTLSFRDYIVAENSILDTHRYKQSESYWTERLDTLPMAPELPLAKDPSEVKNPYFKRRSFKLPAPLWKNLKQRSQEMGVTSTVLMLTLFSMTINRWSKHNRFTLNLTLFNRLPLHEQVNQVIGDFTSLTLLEIEANSAESLTDNASRIQKQLWNDLEYRFFGGTEVLRALNRKLGNVQAVGMPVVFSSTLGLGEEDPQSAKPQGEFDTVVEDAFSITQTSQVWLDHQLSEQMGELVLTWDAIEELFPSNMLDEMFTAYSDLVYGLAKQADDSNQISTIALSENQQRLFDDNNNTAKQRPSEFSELALLHGGFLQQVKQSPLSLAVVHGQHRYDYRSIDMMANQIASKLISHGAKTNQLIAVVMRKGWQQVVSVLGTLYAGAAYLPVDANLPKERIQQILQQGNVVIILTQHEVINKIDKEESQVILTVDESLLTETLEDRVEVPISPLDIAYVIFTSGSTGKPKGVVIDHRGAVNTIIDINERYSVTKTDKVLAVSSLSFDLSVYDVFGLLAAGGTIVIPESDSEKDPRHWLDLVKREKITIWNTVPALAQLLYEEAERQTESLAEIMRIVMMSGDWIPLELPKLIQSISPSADIYSLGGATEASIWSILYPITSIAPDWKSIPYGKPMENQHFYVLDKEMQLRPIWAVGELYIGGIGVALGYWKDDVRTKASFILHPETGERLYKTGDLGRYLPSGDIEFLGREDNQVKINGHRIELGEIESQLNQHQGIKSAVVIAAGKQKFNRRLVAYVVPSTTDNVAIENETDNENNTSLSGILEDKNERAIFKFMQHGLRKFDNDVVGIQLPCDDLESISILSGNLGLNRLLEGSNQKTALTKTHQSPSLNSLGKLAELFASSRNGWLSYTETFLSIFRFFISCTDIFMGQA